MTNSFSKILAGQALVALPVASHLSGEALCQKYQQLCTSDSSGSIPDVCDFIYEASSIAFIESPDEAKTASDQAETKFRRLLNKLHETINEDKSGWNLKQVLDGFICLDDYTLFGAIIEYMSLSAEVIPIFDKMAHILLDYDGSIMDPNSASLNLSTAKQCKAEGLTNGRLPVIFSLLIHPKFSADQKQELMESKSVMEFLSSKMREQLLEELGQDYPDTVQQANENVKFFEKSHYNIQTAKAAIKECLTVFAQCTSDMYYDHKRSQLFDGRSQLLETHCEGRTPEECCVGSFDTNKGLTYDEFLVMCHPTVKHQVTPEEDPEEPMCDNQVSEVQVLIINEAHFLLQLKDSCKENTTTNSRVLHFGLNPKTTPSVLRSTEGVVGIFDSDLTPELIHRNFSQWTQAANGKSKNFKGMSKLSMFSKSSESNVVYFDDMLLRKQLGYGSHNGAPFPYGFFKLRSVEKKGKHGDSTIVVEAELVSKESEKFQKLDSNIVTWEGNVESNSWTRIVDKKQFDIDENLDIKLILSKSTKNKVLTHLGFKNIRHVDKQMAETDREMFYAGDSWPIAPGTRNKLLDRVKYMAQHGVQFAFASGSYRRIVQPWTHTCASFVQSLLKHIDVKMTFDAGVDVGLILRQTYLKTGSRMRGKFRKLEKVLIKKNYY